MEQITPTQSKSYYYLGSILVSIATLVFIALLTLESLLGRAQELYVYSFVTLTLLVFTFSFILTRSYLKKGKEKEIERTTLSILRFVLSTVMLGYAFTKLRNGHMYLSYFSLDNRLDDLSEFDTVWSFYGRFSSFQALIGFLELTPAILLLFRRTAFLGTVIMLPVVSNVLILNVFYHIGGLTLPLSFVLLTFNIYLLYSYKNLILDFLKRINSETSKPTGPRAFTRKVVGVLKFIPLGFVSILILLKIIAPKHPQAIRGAFELVEFKQNGRLVTRDSLPVDAYKKIYFEKRQIQNSLINKTGPQGAKIVFPGKDSITIAYRNGPLDVFVQEDTATMFRGTYTFKQDTILVIQGKQNDQLTEASYKKVGLKEYAYWWE